MRGCFVYSTTVGKLILDTPPISSRVPLCRAILRRGPVRHSAVFQRKSLRFKSLPLRGCGTLVLMGEITHGFLAKQVRDEDNSLSDQRMSQTHTLSTEPVEVNSRESRPYARFSTVADMRLI